MKKNICTILLIVCGYTLSAQLNFNIERLDLFYVNIPPFPEGKIYYDEDLGYGPLLIFNCNFENEGDSIFKIDFYKAKVYAEFYYNKVTYNQELLLNLGVPDNIILKPEESVKIIFLSDLLYNTQLYKDSIIVDYSREMIQILPTLKVRFNYERIFISSSEIKEVVLHDYIWQ